MKLGITKYNYTADITSIQRHLAVTSPSKLNSRNWNDGAANNKGSAHTGTLVVSNVFEHIREPEGTNL